ncbi:aldehyde dehydrogenase family protein [Jiangella asiatica]|uniref:Aldehyde dehydrogenase family protein n=1 Tax=Jiangella asiatica TaxID=2530372 RepID=A0A4R5D9C8_9ACTN|nr:aldehyde dehydrogenase family protein [Jiangella asiatica]
MLPTLIDRVAPDHSLATDELFGPVTVLHPVATLDEAIDTANACGSNLQTAVFTRSIDRAFTAIRAEGGLPLGYHAKKITRMRRRAGTPTRKRTISSNGSTPDDTGAGRAEARSHGGRQSASAAGGPGGGVRVCDGGRDGCGVRARAGVLRGGVGSRSSTSRATTSRRKARASPPVSGWPPRSASRWNALVTCSGLAPRRTPSTSCGSTPSSTPMSAFTIDHLRVRLPLPFATYTTPRDREM